MSITTVSTTIEMSSTEEFMQKFSEICGEKDLLGDEVNLTIVTLHRQDADEASTTLAIQVNQEDQFCTTLRLSTDRVLEICDVLAADEKANVSTFAITQFQNILYSVYGAECDDVATSVEIAKAIDPKSAYQGLCSEIIISTDIEQQVQVTLNVYGEYYLDTTKEEIEFLKAKGLDHLHTPSSPNRRALLFSFQTGTIQKP